MPELCPYCNSGRLDITKNIFDIINPLNIRCAKIKWRRETTLRIYNIFKISSKLPASMII